MDRQARAVRYHGVGDLRIEDVVVPAPVSHEVTVQVAYAGICGSDLHEYYAAQTVTPVDPHPLTGARLPVVLGHEFAGTVVETGPDVTAVAVGDRVAVRPTYSCGHCPACRRGHPNSCTDLAFHGLSAHGGGLSTYTTVTDSMLFALPGAVGLREGALVEPLAVSHHGVAMLLDAAPAVAFVGGAGPIGLGAVAALRAGGIGTVVVAEPSPVRRDLAAKMGATDVYDPADRDLADVLAGRVLDAAVEAAGRGDVVAEAVANLGPRGRLVLLGLHEAPMSFDPTSMLYREVTMSGSSTYTDDDFRAVVDRLADGTYPTGDWTEVRPVDEVLTAFADLRAGTATKILLDLT
ncbi:alcohol dehydrogenase catalytic domain-containing protein [Pseudonocardia alni]|uniref:alcohol dehydrogenase catalytic domain-containing protein n=1 Tax=Pseudonocardia alni TaxID=33907 RepID=UPI00331D23DE